MNEDLKFQQRWEFRRRDGDVDSSSKSSSSGEPVLKKHKLVSSLMSPGNDETSSSPRSQLEGKSDPSSGEQFKIEKANNMHIGSNKKNNLDREEMKRDSFKKVNKKKNKSNAYDPATLDDLKIFMESLLEDLKVARENLLVWMREEMHKLMPDRTNSQSTRKRSGCQREKIQVQHQNNFILGLEAQNCKGGSSDRRVKKMADSTARSTKRKGSNGQENIPAQRPAISELGLKAQNCNGGSIEKSVKGKKPVDSGMNPTRQGQGNAQVPHQENIEAGLETQNCNNRSLVMSLKGQVTASSGTPCEIPKDQVDQGQAIGHLTSTEKNKGEEVLDLSSTRPKFLSNSSDQVAAPLMYLGLPTVLPEPSYENYRLNSSICNYTQTQPGIAGNKMAITSERSNLLAPSGSIRLGNFLGFQQDEKLGSFYQMGSRNVSAIDQSHIPASSFSSGFPVPLHQSLNGCFNIPNQISLENVPRENNILGLQMNGGAIRFSAGSNAFAEHFIANNLHSHLNYKAEGGVRAFQTPDINDRYLFPK